MSIQDDESTGKYEGEVKFTPSIIKPRLQEVAPPLVSTSFLVLTRKVQSFIFCTVCFVSFFDIVDAKYSCLKLTSIVKREKFLVWLIYYYFNLYL